jgi:hypothetical protein
VIGATDLQAMIQIAIWYLEGYVTDINLSFVSCGAPPNVPVSKNGCLNQLVTKLIQAAQNNAPVGRKLATSPARPSTRATATASTSNIRCCMDSTPPSDNEEYVQFTACPTDVSKVNGQYVIGPFMLDTNVVGEPTVTATLSCLCDDAITTTITDSSGNAVDPALDDPFYVAIAAPDGPYCVDVEACITTPDTLRKVITSCADVPYPDPGAYYQCTITTEEGEIGDEICTTMCVCVQLSEDGGGSDDDGGCCGPVNIMITNTNDVTNSNTNEVNNTVNVTVPPGPVTPCPPCQPCPDCPSCPDCPPAPPCPPCP